ncbi:MAG: LPS assembly protein LptD [Pseudomonadota bacterium]|nr:LPS assembly protein LptD [Pseudomonadota bacterium]
MKYSSICLFLCVVIFSPFAVCAAKPLEYKPSLTNQVDISARYLEHKKEQNVYIAKGDVDIKEGARILNADSLVYDDNSKEIFAEGNILLQDEGDVIECEKLYLNLVTKTGTIEKGKIFVKKGGFQIAGEHINKVGESQYKIKNGEITTCEGERPAWKFLANDIDVTIEGYAKTKGAKFQILNTTVFYLPWGIFPVKTERQSGLLMPSFALSSRDGTKLKTSYFWAISKDKDATFYLDYIGDRGIKPGAEFRYALAETFKGTLYSTIVSDRKYDRTRYQIKATHDQVMWKDLALKIKTNYVSDVDYMKDFGDTTTERSENLIKSTAYLEKPLPKSLLTIEGSYFKNLTHKNNDYVFQYLPSISFFTEYLPILKERFYTDIYAGLTSFRRAEGANYTRFSLEPRLRMPLSWQGINFLINGTLYETGYTISKSDTANNSTEVRQTAKIEGDANVQFLRNYTTEFLNIGEMQSIVKPQLTYIYIPNTSFSGIPNIDPYDRMYNTNVITYSLHHYLNTMSDQKFRELSLFEIAQTYGISGNLEPSTLYDGSGSRFSNIKTKLTLYPVDNFSYTNESTINTSGNGIAVMRNSLNHKYSNLYWVNLSHYYTSSLSNELFSDIGGFYKPFEGKYQIRYSFKDGTWIDTMYQLTYRPDCWALTLALIQSTRPRDTTFRLSLDLAGITSMQ